ncbi:MAG: glycosyltransferase, partial [Gemmatimonadota bacterium]|nr:glycosyltransferase [Gemmatimonadota bacterium]
PVHYLAVPNRGLTDADALAVARTVCDEVAAWWPAPPDHAGASRRDRYQALLLARAVRERGIRHLHAHFATAATTVARLAAHIAGVPYTFTAHAKDIYHTSVDPGELREKLCDAAAVVTVSDFNDHYLHARFGDDATAVHRVYNGLDLARFPYEAPAVRPPRIVAVGRLVEKKGFADLVDACAVLAGRGIDFTCAIIGGGPLEDELRSRILERGLLERVTLLGARTLEEVTAAVRDAAALAAPCVVGEDGNRDGLPTVLLEAMALGTPCVSTDVTGIPELITDAETGLIVPQHDPTALALALERLLGSAELRVRLAEAARSVIEREFDIHRNTRAMRALFAGAGIATRATA